MICRRGWGYSWILKYLNVEKCGRFQGNHEAKNSSLTTPVACSWSSPIKYDVMNESFILSVLTFLTFSWKRSCGRSVASIWLPDAQHWEHPHAGRCTSCPSSTATSRTGRRGAGCPTPSLMKQRSVTSLTIKMTRRQYIKWRSWRRYCWRGWGR
jgi:hypothetical protein